MKLFDDVSESLSLLLTNLERKCPQCGYDLNIVPETLGKRFPVIECPQCHLTIEVSTRNNHRITMVIGIVVPFALALGLFLQILI